MSLSKNVDLKCSETLRDSPPPPPPPPQLQLSHSLGNTSVFASTVVAPSPNPPSHQTLLPLATTGHSGTAFSHFSPQAQAATVSLLVRKFESQRGPSPVGRIPTTESPNASISSGKAGNATTGSSLPFGITNVVSTTKPSLSSHYTLAQHAPATLPSPQQSSHVFSGLPLPSAAAASVWPFVQHHAVLPSQLSTSPAKQAVFASASSIQSSPTKVQGAASAGLPLSLSPSKGSGSLTQGRPVTLHVSTSRGPAVLQLQQSATTTNAASTTGSGKQSVKLLPAPAGVISPSSHHPSQAAGSANAVPARPVVATLPASTGPMTGNIVTPRVLRPSPLHPMAVATAAFLNQLVPNTHAFGLVDPHSQHLQQQQLQAALLRSPLANVGAVTGATVIPHVVALNQHLATQANTAGGRSVIVSMAGSHLLPGAGSQTTVASGTSGSASGAASSTKSLSSAPLTPSSASAAITPSPTRPSILRKRMTDMSNGSNSGSPTAKRLAYEPITLAKRGNDKGAMTPDSDSRPGTSLASAISSSTVENPEAGNSNQSSSASTISAGSMTDNGNGHGANSSQATITGSPSPRKRPRKQQLSELRSCQGYGSDDDTSTPVMSYRCEPVEEETVIGPTGAGGLDGRYLPASMSPQRSQFSIGQGSVFMAGDVYDQYHSPMKRQTIKSEHSGSLSVDFLRSQRQSHAHERPSTSFDQLQQQIEQQRKHVPEYRPRPSLLSQYELPYDSKRYHFSVQEDVRPKDEKRPTIVEMSNQKQILQRIGGWKVHLMAVQFDNVDQDEKTNYEDLNELHGLLNSWASLEAEDRVGQMDFPDAEERTEIETLKEMTSTNMQRVRVIREQFDDYKKQLLSILKHKSNVERLVHRYTTKRPVKKKERGRNGTIVE